MKKKRRNVGGFIGAFFLLFILGYGYAFMIRAGYMSEWIGVIYVILAVAGLTCTWYGDVE